MSHPARHRLVIFVGVLKRGDARELKLDSCGILDSNSVRKNPLVLSHQREQSWLSGGSTKEGLIIFNTMR